MSLMLPLRPSYVSSVKNATHSIENLGVIVIIGAIPPYISKSWAECNTEFCALHLQLRPRGFPTAGGERCSVGLKLCCI